MADLCVLDENGAIAQRREIGDQPVAVGRDETAEVTILDNTLSRRHFLIWRQQGRFRIKDLNSQNGTWVDGQRAQGTELRHTPSQPVQGRHTHTRAGDGTFCGRANCLLCRANPKAGVAHHSRE
jgi:hypothetical protein